MRATQPSQMDVELGNATYVRNLGAATGLFVLNGFISNEKIYVLPSIDENQVICGRNWLP